MRRNYHHCDQNYEKMRKDLIIGFYGDKKSGYKGVTPSRVKALTESCEKDMLEWLNKYNKSNYTDLKDFKPENKTSHIDQAEEFQFDNSMIPEEETGFPFLDDESSDEI